MNNELLTTGQLAKRTKMSFARVLYLLQTRRIDPVMRLGSLRLYGAETVDQLNAIGRQIEQKRRTVPS